MSARVIFARVVWRAAAVALIITAAISGSVIVNQHINAVDRREQNLQAQINALNNDINALAHGLHVVLPEPLPTATPAGATHGGSVPSPHATSAPATSSPTPVSRTTPQPTPRPTTTPVVCLVTVCVG